MGRTSLRCMQRHSGGIDVGMGIRPDAPNETNIEEAEKYFDRNNMSEGEEKRQKVKKAVEALDDEFKSCGADHGWFYPSADVESEGKRKNHDGQSDADGELKIREYVPTTIPGHHVPHAWLLDGKGNRRATMQMIKDDRFILLASSTAWTTLESQDMEVILVDDGSGEGWKDVDGAWAKQRGVTSTGAVLVRPDGIVAYRFQDDTFARQPDVAGKVDELLRKLLRL